MCQDTGIRYHLGHFECVLPMRLQFVHRESNLFLFYIEAMFPLSLLHRLLEKV
jgi:hypothetical protein